MNISKTSILNCLVLAGTGVGWAWAGPSVERKVYIAQRLDSNPPLIDGKLDDACWEKASWETGFVQREPYEGEKPTQETAFNILYDDDNLYIAVSAYDNEPGSIEKRVTRRDDRQGDHVSVTLDSYFDHRTAFVFNVNAAGVKSDYVISEDGNNEDNGWDPVWDAKVEVGNERWTAEMQIPLTQLRFGNQEERIWGFQVWRWLHRKEELSGWQFIPKDAPGMVHMYGELHGINNIETRRQIELLPYAVAQTERFEAEEGNPFATGRSSDVEAGLDGKVAVTSDLTLNFTANPDFGQVEADPSVVNLTTQETFFVEKRPFFIEGRNILNFQVMGGDGDFSQDNLFYSRRIGRPPQHEPETEDDEYMLMPQNTSILGAFKLTGKTGSGLSVGVLESITAKEHAEMEFNGERRQEAVEPFSNYLLGRLQKDWDQGNRIFGGMFTATNRKIEDSSLDFLQQAAYTGGLDFYQAWKNKTYYVSAKTLFSNVRGSSQAIQEVQESAVRYFQRPDASHVSVDPTLTSLSGHGGTLNLGKGGEGHLRFSVGTTWRSPGLELNDVGYLRNADKIMQWTWAGYRIWRPFSIFRSFNLNFNQWRGWDFSGENIFDGGNVGSWGQFKNYWGFSVGINRQGESLATSMLRGGPSLRWPGGLGSWFNMNTDSRKKLRFDFGGWNYWDDEDSSREKNFWFGGTYRPSNALAISLEPTISIERRELQYVDTVDFEGAERYILGYIEQRTAGITIRLNYSITPDLSIQYYGQPFVSAGDYTRFKRITEPRADRFTDRFHTYASTEISYDPEEKEYLVDETGNGLTDYRFDDPNFNFRQFRSNLVLRWEYSPGSTLYVVWSQERTEELEMGEFSLAKDVHGLFDIQPHDVFLVKLSRWLAF